MNNTNLKSDQSSRSRSDCRRSRGTKKDLYIIFNRTQQYCIYYIPTPYIHVHDVFTTVQVVQVHTVHHICTVTYWVRTVVQYMYVPITGNATIYIGTDIYVQ